MEKTGVTIFKSLLKNSACVDGARHKKWFIALILAFIALICSLVPTFVTFMNTKGDAFLKSSTYNIDSGLVAFASSKLDGSSDFEIKLDDNNKKYLSVPTGTMTEYFVHTHKVDHYNDNGELTGYDDVVDFIVHIYDQSNENLENTTFKAFKNIIKAGSVNPYHQTLDANSDYKGKSFMILSKTKIYVCLFGKGGKASEFNGDFKTFKVGYKMSSIVEEVAHDENRFTNIMKKYYSFFTKSYETNRVSAVVQQTLILAGVNAAIICFMGLMMFILTRGKQNPFRIYTLWDTQKIAYWASLTPAILSIALGFLFAQFASMVFVFLFGIRIMWLTMKELRPQLQQQ